MRVLEQPGQDGGVVHAPRRLVGGEVVGDDFGCVDLGLPHLFAKGGLLEGVCRFCIAEIGEGLVLGQQFG